MTIPVKTALIRFGRIVVFGAITSAVGLALENVGIFDDTSFAPFVVIATAALGALDKYVREKRNSWL